MGCPLFLTGSPALVLLFFPKLGRESGLVNLPSGFLPFLFGLFSVQMIESNLRARRRVVLSMGC